MPESLCCADHAGPGKKPCLTNPNCYYGLGERKRGIWSDKPKLLADIGDDPSYRLRNPLLQPAGLLNLGATCYLNSLVQVLFLNLPFRAAVYAWRPPTREDVAEFERKRAALAARAAAAAAAASGGSASPSEIDLTAIGGSATSPSNAGSSGSNSSSSSSTAARSAHPSLPDALPSDDDVKDMRALQRLFADMQYSRQSYVDTRQFVTRFQIDAGYQQDAGEFNKMLLSHVEGIMSRSAHLPASLRGIVKTLFSGKTEYVTRCRTCGNKSTRTEDFSELELAILGAGSVEEALVKWMASEELTGDNKYECSSAVCNGRKSDADRYHRLSSLPPILNVSLLRFVYDVAIGNKKKVKDAIAIPDVLDVGAIIAAMGREPPASSDNSNGSSSAACGRQLSPDPILYELNAVLYHKGTSAHHGHYVSDAWDPERKVRFTSRLVYFARLLRFTAMIILTHSSILSL